MKFIKDCWETSWQAFLTLSKVRSSERQSASEAFFCWKRLMMPFKSPFATGAKLSELQGMTAQSESVGKEAEILVHPSVCFGMKLIVLSKISSTS